MTPAALGWAGHNLQALQDMLLADYESYRLADASLALPLT